MSPVNAIQSAVETLMEKFIACAVHTNPNPSYNPT